MAGKIYDSDVLVVGSGLAGLLYALKLNSQYSVNIVTKGLVADSSTSRAQGGIATVTAGNDSFDEHIADTIKAGAGLCHPDVVENIIACGPRIIEELTSLGVEFSRNPDGNDFDLGLEGGHSKRRVLHVKDHTGLDIERVLAKRVGDQTNISVFENHMGVNLYVRNNQVYGAHVLDGNTGDVERFSSRVTVLATGGAGRVFLYTSNPDVATGDGIAMAYRAGASITNMEMVQFHPTLLYHPKVRAFLITETLRGEGALLLGRGENRFMPDYHSDAELAPRDIVARAIDNELKKTGADHVWLDISFKDKDFIVERFPAIYEKCMEAGIDMTQEPIPVVPSAHYIMGGIRVDIHGRTDVKGLFAIGETACVGFHGANRLASNSLLEASALALNAAEVLNDELEGAGPPVEIPAWDPGAATDPDELVVISHMWDEIRRLMANYVGIVRSNKRLIRARNRIGFLAKEISVFYWDFKVNRDLLELRNIATVAELIIRMARMRRESRGAHFNKDHPELADEAVDTLVRKGYAPVD